MTTGTLTKPRTGIAPSAVTAVPERRKTGAWLKERIEASNRLPPGEFLTEVRDVTPAMASFILEMYNKENRPISKSKVDELTRAMREGRWKLTHQGMGFSRSGLLHDGQHRLKAIVQSGVTVPILFVFGEEDDAFDVLDIMRLRTAADILSMAGYKEPFTVSAAVRLILAIQDERAFTSAARYYPNDVVLAAAATLPGLDEIALLGRKIGRKLKTTRSSMVAALYLIKTQTEFPDRFDEFTAALYEGVNLPALSPIILLRDVLQRNVVAPKGQRGMPRAAAEASAIIKAWNLWIRGAQRSGLNALRPRPDHPFPRPV